MTEDFALVVAEYLCQALARLHDLADRVLVSANMQYGCLRGEENALRTF